MIKISVVVPVFNMEKYIGQCLDSILSQGLGEIEVLCIDDGSRDHSAQIIRRYSATDLRVKLISQTNQGVGNARNHGIRAAQGKYIAFMDPDDYYPDSGVLADLYAAAEQNQVLVCGGSLCEDHNNGKWFRKKFHGDYAKHVFREERYTTYREYQFDYGFYRFLYNREFLVGNHIFFPPYARFQDPPFFVKAMILAGGFYALPRITYCYRVGHQVILWDEKRICAVLSGFIDNLAMSKEAGLRELHCLTLERMLFEFREQILTGLNIQSKEILHLLREAESCIEPAYVSDDEDYRDGIPRLLDEWGGYSKAHRDGAQDLEAIQNSRRSIPARIYSKVKKIPRKIKRYIKKQRSSSV